MEMLHKDTFLDVGVPRMISRFVRLSNHPKSFLYKLAQAANPSAISSEEVPTTEITEEGVLVQSVKVVYHIDVNALLGHVVAVDVKRAARGNHYGVRSVVPIQIHPNTIATLPASINQPYSYDAISDQLFAGAIESVPKGLVAHLKETVA